MADVTEDHNLEGERARTGQYLGRHWRDAYDGGWFAFDMPVDPDAHNALQATLLDKSLNFHSHKRKILYYTKVGHHVFPFKGRMMSTVFYSLFNHIFGS